KRAREGDLPGAEAMLRELVEDTPTHAYAWTNLGILHERLAQDDRALEDYARALALAPGQTEANLNVVRLRARKGEVARAEAEARKRLSQHPDAHGARLGIAQALLLRGETTAATIEAKQVL